MLLSLVWIVLLWRRQTTDLAALRGGLVFFLAGEVACAANYVFFGGNSAITDYLHSYGMAVGFSFISYAALEGVDGPAGPQNGSALDLLRVPVHDHLHKALRFAVLNRTRRA